MSESFSWTKNAVWAASTLRARAAAITGLPLVPRAGEAWEVDLEAAVWKCRAQNVAEVDLEAGLPWRGRPVVSHVSASSMRRTPTPRRARGKSQPKSRPANRQRAQTPRRSSTPVRNKAEAEAPASAPTVPEVTERAVPSTATPAGPADAAPRTGRSPSTSSKEVRAEAPESSKVEAKAAPGPREPPAQEAAAASQVSPDDKQQVRDVRELPELPTADAPKLAIPKAPEVPKPKAAPARKYSTPRPDLNKEHQQSAVTSAPKDRPEGEPKIDAESSTESVSKALQSPQAAKLQASVLSMHTRGFEPIAPTAGTAPLCVAPPVSVTLRTAGLGKSTHADVQKITVAAPSPAKAKAFARQSQGDHPPAHQADGVTKVQEETPSREGSCDSCKSEKLVVPTKNKERLGMLQCGGCKRAPVRSSWREGLGGAVAVPTLPTSWATDLPDSGIEAGAIADWMEGRLSWHGCFCRIVDALRRYTPEEGESRQVAEDAAADMGRQAQKVLAEHIELMSQSSLLALLAGGAPSMRSDARTLEGLLPAQPKEKPAQALANAHQWFIGGIGLGPGGMRDPGGGSLQMALAFRRLQLRAHPAANGSQQMLLDASVFLETLRAASLAQCGRRLPRHDDVGREMTDQELLLLLDIKSRRDDGALETEGFLDPPKAHRLAAYARALGEIRTDLKALQKVLSLDNARQLLGLGHSASTEDLAKAYRRKARQLHPDRQGETSTGAFQALQGAYELLLSHKDGIARASQVDVVPKIGPGETVVRGVEFVLPKRSGADELALRADLCLRAAQAFADMQLLMRKPPSRAAPRAQTMPGQRTSEPLEPVPEAEPHEEDEAAESGMPGQPERPGRAMWRASSRSGRSRLALHCAGTVNHAGEEAARVGLNASGTQAQVLPLLMAVLDVSATMPEELFGNVTREAKKCLSQMRSALALGTEACEMGFKASNQAMQYSDCEAFWEPQGESGKTLGDEVMEMASQAALHCAAAVMVLSDGFEAAQRLAASLQQALNVRAKTMGDEMPERNRREEEPEPEGKLTERLRLLRIAGEIHSSNKEMLQWQEELREAVLCRPHLLDPVSVWEKEALFCMASEVLESLQGRLSEVEVDLGMEPLEAVFSVTFAAAAFRRVASPPSIEARLLRLAALVHAALLRKMLEEFFSTCLSDLGNRGHPVRIVEILRRRCNAALAEFYWLQADAPVRTHTDQLDS